MTAADSIAIGVRPAVDVPEHACTLVRPRVPRAAALAAAAGLASWLGAHGAAPAAWPASGGQYFDVRATMLTSVEPTAAQRAAMTALAGARVRWHAQYGAP